LFREHSNVRRRDSVSLDDAQLGTSLRLAPDVIDPLLALEVRHRGGTVIVGVAGDLDVSTVFELRDLLAHIMSESSPRELVVDLRDLHSVDSMGLAVFRLAHERAAARGLRFVLENPNSFVSRLLEISGLTDARDIVAPTGPTSGDTPRAGTDAGQMPFGIRSPG
jgi:anti-anti-sigma factor